MKIRCLFSLATLAVLGAPAGAQDKIPGPEVPDPVREFRGTWVASVRNIDWPSRPGLKVKTQQSELRAIFDKCKALNLNAVILQVRPAADALYKSETEPWSGFLSSREGRDPGYDPLAFAIREAHARGLELHAWFNPFRASISTNAPHDSKHISVRKRSVVRTYRNQLWLDPGDPWVRDYVVNEIRDVASRYDVDGIHIDDYFYPYPPEGEKCNFPDDETYKAHGGGQDRDDWRRANVNTFVQKLSAAVKSARPQAKFGISPFGIWQPDNPEKIEAELNAYEHIYTDSKKWLNNGWCDYFSPQLYWRIEPPEQSFTKLLKWWAEQNTQGRHLWPGIATSRINSNQDPGRPASEIADQIEAAREFGGGASLGHIHWNYSALEKNPGGIAKLLRSKQYATKAMVPTSAWLRGSVPRRPSLTARSGSKFSWFPVEQKDETRPRWWCIQARYGDRWELIDLVPADRLRYSLNNKPDITSVRGVSADGTLGLPSIIVRRGVKVPKSWIDAPDDPRTFQQKN